VQFPEKYNEVIRVQISEYSIQETIHKRLALISAIKKINAELNQPAQAEKYTAAHCSLDHVMTLL
jgi:hypothetical protein